MNLYEQFKEQKENIENVDNIKNINIELLVEFNNHIFSNLPKDKLNELKESININGVLSPIIVRPKGSKYEIISGHNRVRCCKELCIKEIPAIIKEYDDNRATLIMLETNLCQREDILPVEKGQAYKMKLELLKNTKNTSDIKEFEEKNHNGFLEGTEDSMTQIRRFIRLTNLSKDLQDKVNNKELSILAGVELSYLKEEEQNIVNAVLEETKIKLSVLQSQKIRYIKNNISYENIMNILNNKKIKVEKFTGKLEKRAIKVYKSKFNSDKEFTDLVIKLLEQYFIEDTK